MSLRIVPVSLDQANDYVDRACTGTATRCLGLMTLWDMLAEAQAHKAAQAERLAEEQRLIDLAWLAPVPLASLPRAVRVWPPGCCACFEGHCRGGEVVNGRLANGMFCKEELPR